MPCSRSSDTSAASKRLRFWWHDVHTHPEKRATRIEGCAPQAHNSIRCRITVAVGITLALLILPAYFFTKRRTRLHRPAAVVSPKPAGPAEFRCAVFIVCGEILGLAYKKGAEVELNIAQVQSSQSPLHGCAKAARILIADDDAFMRRLLTHVVERTRLCCNVAIAENGHQAWQLYQRDGADLIITDNSMPVMDGIALTKAIRQEQPELPIIMVSGSADLQQARAAGASIFLQKPFQIQCLLQNIVRCLSTHAIA